MTTLLFSRFWCELFCSWAFHSNVWKYTTKKTENNYFPFFYFPIPFISRYQLFFFDIVVDKKNVPIYEKGTVSLNIHTSKNCLCNSSCQDKKTSELPMAQSIPADTEKLIALSKTTMPFGKYKNRLLIDLPEPYLVWFSRKGFPKGPLGEMLKSVYEIKLNGLEYLFEPLR